MGTSHFKEALTFITHDVYVQYVIYAQLCEKLSTVDPPCFHWN